MSEKKQSVIVAPHPDDEIIGLFDILNDSENMITIIYGAEATAARREEVKQLREIFQNVNNQIFHNSFPSAYALPETTLYFPDPINELHPSHRGWGSIGEQYARAGFDVVFYTTNMNVPYIYEVKDPQKKEAMLNRVYSSQKQLWETEKKYILFEGHCKWVF